MRSRVRTRMTAAVLAVTATASIGLAAPVQAAAGDLDNQFGIGGLVEIPDESTNAGMAVQAGGKVVAAYTNAAGRVVVVRLLRNGNLDSTFSNDGMVVLAPLRTTMKGVAVAVDGTRIVVLAEDSQLDDRRIEVIRLLSSGALDRSFGGGDGRTSFMGTVANRRPVALHVMADGRVVVAANETESGTGAVIHRLTVAGRPDTTFSNDGEAVVPFGGVVNDAATSIDVRESDGGIVVSGERSEATRITSVIARVSASGRAVRSFGTRGSVVLANGDDLATLVRDVQFTSRGRLVGGGYALDNAGTTSRLLAVSVTADGAMDPSFSGDGYRTVSFPMSSYAFSIDVQADGKVLIGGALVDSPTWVVARLRPNGGLDDSFSGDGRSTIDVQHSPTATSTIQLSPSGQRLYVSGAIRVLFNQVVVAAVQTG